jgi:hypothetical protein
MNWFQENKFLGTYLVVVALLVIGLGAFLFISKSGYAEALTTYESTRKKVENLKTQPLYPDDKNLKLKEAAVKEYNEEAKELHKLLAASYPPKLREGVSPSDVQDSLKSRILKLQELAAQRSVSLPPDFPLGMETYRNKAPREDAAAILDYQLAAIDYLATMAINSGITSIDGLDRQVIPIEEGKKEEPKPEPTKKKKSKKKTAAKPKKVEPPKVLDRYPLTFAFTGRQGSVMNFFREISNTPANTFFYELKVARVESGVKEGPTRGAVEIKEVDASELIDENAVPAMQDAQTILGNDLIKVSAVIDIIRFPEAPEEEEAAATDAAPEEGADN